MPSRKRSETDGGRTAADEPSLADLRDAVLSAVTGLEWLLPQIGVDDSGDLLEEWRDRVGATNILRLCTRPHTPRFVADQWHEHVDKRRPFNLIQLFAFEAATASIPSAFASSGQGSLTRILQDVYWQLGVGLYAHAKTLTFQRPFVTVRALELSRAYLRLFIELDHGTSGGMTEARGRMATAIALINRYASASERELRDAEQDLVLSMDSGNTHESARAYLAELRLGLFDLTDDRGYLVAVITESTQEDSASLRVSHLEAYVRLACLPTTGDLARRAYLHEAQDIAENVHHWDLDRPEAYARLRILRECVRAAASRAPDVTANFLRGTRLPFDVHRKIRATSFDDEDGEWLAFQIVRILGNLPTVAWPPIVRRVYADCCRAMANSFRPGDQRIAEYLSQAIYALRTIPDANQVDASTRLHLGNDMLKLAEVKRDPELRQEGFGVLAEVACTSDASATPLVLLGAALEAGGGVTLTSNKKIPEEWVQQLADGDYRSMYRLAAERALNSADLAKRYLGSRESVLTVDDHLELASGAIIFKGTTVVNYQREKLRLEALRKVIASKKLRDFALPEVIGTYDLPSTNATFGPQGEVVIMLRVANGATLGEVAAKLDHSDALRLMERAADFLGIIHSAPEMRMGSIRSPRRRLRTSEIGVWLRNLLGEAGQAEFDEWWSLVSHLSCLPKRDAHPGNWIVDDGRLTAVDFESAGVCPLGWEIAQLTDDVPVFAIDEHWRDARMRVVDSYITTLRANGMSVSHADVRRGYLAGLLARGVRALTDPEYDLDQRRHGLSLLKALASDEEDADLSALARRWLQGAERTRATLSPGRAIATSKVLAYVLRHDATVDRDPGGWVDVQDVLRRTQELGRPVSPQELVSVATLAKERRFEVADGKVRARYGHSAAVDIGELAHSQPPRLFHASSFGSFDAIFGKREGLRPMKRARCHLSSSPAAAHAAGERHLAPVMLTVKSDVPDLFEQASERTWLAKHVPCESLEIVSLPEQFQLRTRRFRI